MFKIPRVSSYTSERLHEGAKRTSEDPTELVRAEGQLSLRRRSFEHAKRSNYD